MDCVYVSFTRLEHYRTFGDLRSSLQGKFSAGPLQEDQVDDLLNRTGNTYESKTFISSPFGRSAVEAMADEWLMDPVPAQHNIGLLFYIRMNQTGHCVNFVNRSEFKRMDFVDFQTLHWAGDHHFQSGLDCWEDVSEAEKIVIVWEPGRTGNDDFLPDSNLKRRRRAEKMLKANYHPFGYSIAGGQELIRDHFGSRIDARDIEEALIASPVSYSYAYPYLYRYSIREKLERIAARPWWALEAQDRKFVYEAEQAWHTDIDIMNSQIERDRAGLQKLGLTKRDIMSLDYDSLYNRFHVFRPHGLTKPEPNKLKAWGLNKEMLDHDWIDELKEAYKQRVPARRG